MKAGALIIGSLFWERERWPKDLLDFDRSVVCDMPIRYGRISQRRNDAFTMILSRDAKPGKALIVPFRPRVDQFSDLCGLAHTLAVAETEGRKCRLVWDWGCVGLLLPKSATKWATDWRSLAQTRSAEIGKVILAFRKNAAPLDKYAIVHSNLWPPEANKLKLTALLCAISAPKPPATGPRSARDIAAPMSVYPENKAFEYFIENRKSGITTDHDAKIWRELTKKV